MLDIRRVYNKGNIVAYKETPVVYQNVYNSFLNDGQKNITLTFSDDTVVTNELIAEESLSIKQMISDSEQFTIGGLCSSEFCIKLFDNGKSYKGLSFTATIESGGVNISLGSYKVYSDARTSDGLYKNIVAYDALYDLVTVDVATWYNSLQFPMTLLAFRNSLFEHLSVSQRTATLPNDSIQIDRTMEATAISGADIISSICEVNGCNGIIDSEGYFKYVLIGENILELDGDDYIQGGLQYEDYATDEIDGVLIRESEDDSGVLIGTGNNTYTIDGNILLYGKQQSDLQTIGANILEVLEGFSYVPSSLISFGKPWVEVGDAVKVTIGEQTIYFPILERTLSGINGLRDTYVARGKEQLTEQTNSISRQITKLLNRTVELQDETTTARSEIRQANDKINLVVENGSTSSSLTITDSAISAIADKLEVTGDMVVDGTIDAEKLNVQQLFAEGVNVGTFKIMGSGYSLNFDDLVLSSGSTLTKNEDGSVTIDGTASISIPLTTLNFKFVVESYSGQEASGSYEYLTKDGTGHSEAFVTPVALPAYIIKTEFVVDKDDDLDGNVTFALYTGTYYAFSVFAEDQRDFKLTYNMFNTNSKIDQSKRGVYIASDGVYLDDINIGKGKHIYSDGKALIGDYTDSSGNPYTRLNHGNNRLIMYDNGDTGILFYDGAFRPQATDTVTLGISTRKFKEAYITDAKATKLNGESMAVTDTTYSYTTLNTNAGSDLFSAGNIYVRKYGKVVNISGALTSVGAISSSTTILTALLPKPTRASTFICPAHSSSYVRPLYCGVTTAGNLTVRYGGGAQHFFNYTYIID